MIKAYWNKLWKPAPKPLPVHEKTTLESEHKQYTLEPEATVTTNYEAENATVLLGNLEIIHKAKGPSVGFGTEVYLDGVELKNVKRIAFDLDAQSVVKATIEVYP